MSALQLYTAPRFVEQFEILKCRVVNLMREKHGEPLVLAFTSVEPGEGVSSVAVNFTAALVHDHTHHVLLVDGNLNRPTLHKYFHANGKKSDETAISKKGDFKLPTRTAYGAEVMDWQILQANTHLDVILTRQLPNQPNRTFRMAEFGNFLHYAREKYQCVVIDCPPLNHASGGALISSKADAVVLVVEADRVRREVIQRSVNLLEDLGANILGVVLNKRRYPIPGFIYKML